MVETLESADSKAVVLWPWRKGRGGGYLDWGVMGNQNLLNIKANHTAMPVPLLGIQTPRDVSLTGALITGRTLL